MLVVAGSNVVGTNATRKVRVVLVYSTPAHTISGWPAPTSSVGSAMVPGRPEQGIGLANAASEQVRKAAAARMVFR
jgi:hypothetical protein